MLIPDLFQKWNIHPRGIIHIGAHRCEERDIYNKIGCDDSKVIWIEGNPELFVEMKNTLPQVQIYNAIISDECSVVDFIITNNEGMSSSFLELKEHLISHPDCLEEKRIKNLKTTTLTTLVEQYNIDMNKYNFLIMDIQGAELHALKGMTEILKHFDGMYIEVNDRELYKDCGLLPDVTKFLSEHGFVLRDIQMAGNFGWGDAYYCRV